MLVRKYPRRILFILLTAALMLAACNVGATAAPTVDVNAINTAAVGTAMGQIAAQLTQTALAVPTNTPPPLASDTPLSLSTLSLPTSGASPTGGVPGAIPTVSFNTTPTTPIAGFTPVVIGSPVAPTAPLGDACNNSAYIADVTYPDNSVVKPGVNFEKVWRVQNTGNCTWDEGYRLVFIAGDKALDPVNFRFEDSADFVAGGETADLGIDLTAPLQVGTYSATWRMQSDSGVFFGTLLTVVIEVKK